MTRRVYINAAGAIEIDRHFDKSYKALALESIRKMEKRFSAIEPEAVVVSSMSPESMGEQIGLAGIIADYLGLRRLKVFRVEMGEASGLAAIMASYSLIASGLVNRVLVIGVEKVTELATSHIVRVYSMIGDSEYMGLYGISPASEASMIAKLYMARYGYSYEELFKWSITMHRNAVRNPHAQLKFMIKADAYRDSPIISEPLRLLDAYPFGDGASAVYMSSKPGDIAVEILGIGSSNDAHDAVSREDPLFFSSIRESFGEALRMAGINRDLINYLEIHDSYTPYSYIILESMGFAEKGEAPKRFSPDTSSIDRVYVNLSGGLKARGHPWGATGIYQVYELFQILVGEWNPIGVDMSNGYAAAQSMNGAGAQSYIAILRRAR
jgi:acetyl-CoA C-acetyltransferase/acetyl-CoA acyltransferase